MFNKAKTLSPALVALALCASSALYAQDRDRNRDPSSAAGPDRAQDQERVQDRDPDRIADRDRVQDRDQDRVAGREPAQDRDQDRARDADQAQDRDRDQLQLHVQDVAQFRSRDIYGAELMSREERRQYRERLQAIGDERAWVRFRAEHQVEMQERAREQGVELPPPFYGQPLMTDQERERLRERLEEAQTAQQREQILAQHREQMQERAREHDVQLSELEQGFVGTTR